MRGAAFAPLAVAAALPTLAAAQDRDNIIDARVRASAEAAQSDQGPLDGGWTLVGAGGAALFAFQLVDRAGGRDPLEGAFRDLRREPVPGDIGVVDRLDRSGDGLSLTLREGAGPVTITLRPDGGDWSGEMREGAGAATPVKLRRN